MSDDRACIVQFENDQTRALRSRGWRIDIIDVAIWRRPIDGYIATSRYAVRGSRKVGALHEGTIAEGDTVERAIENFICRIARFGEQVAA